MDRKRALEILGLSDKAAPDEISNRVGILLKKFRQMDRDENGNTLADVEIAYKTLSGIAYRDEEEEKKKHYRQAHPNPLFKLFKLDEEKVRNFIYYYKWHFIIGLAAIILVVSSVLSIINKVDPELKMIVAGDIFIADVEPLENRIQAEIGVPEVLVQNIILSEKGDPQTQMMMRQKYVVEISAGDNDVFILDESHYRELAGQGALKPMESFLKKIQYPGLGESKNEDLKVALDVDDGNTYEPELYGLDVSQSALLKDNGIIGERLIVAFGYSGKYTENAEALVKKLLE